MHWPFRLSRARTYIGVGTLFCVTLPDEIRYGIGVRMCAPSMPLPSPPSTRLSRVAPHDACFCTSTSGTPYLAKRPFSLATNSGAASVSAMKPSLAPLTSGPAACAKAPDGNCARAAPSNAAVPALAFRNPRRLMPLLRLLLVIVSVFLSGSKLCCSCPARAGHPTHKKTAARSRLFQPPQVSGVACGPSLDLTPKLGSGVVLSSTIQVSCQPGAFPDCS